MNSETRKLRGGNRQITTKRGRWYERADKDGKYESVTTVLGDAEPKPWLGAWAAKMVATDAVANYEYLGTVIEKDGRDGAIRRLKGIPWAKRDRAADVGSVVHAACEEMVLLTCSADAATESAVRDKYDEHEWDGKYRQVFPYVDQFAAFLSDFQPIIEATEATVFNDEHRYAGTLDLILRLPDIILPGTLTESPLILIDIKTGAGVYDSAGLQLSAYRYGGTYIPLPDGTEVPVPAVDGCAVLWLQPDRYELIPLLADEQVYALFLALLQVSRGWVHGVKDSVIGEPVSHG